MSDTPITDKACGWPVGHHGRIDSSDLELSPDGPFVHSSVARELERENAELRELTSTLGAPNHINIPVEKWRELREDKERLDWLAVTDVWFDEPATESYTPETFRAEIDRKRKEAQP